MSAEIWRKSEMREIGPFFEAEDLADALDRAEIRLSPDGQFTSETRLTVAEHEVSTFCPQVRPQMAQIQCPDGLRPADLSLILLVGSSSIKKSTICDKYDLDHEIPEVISVPRAVLRSVGGAPPVNIALTLCLNAARPPRPGWPHAIGHVLARKTFQARPEVHGEGFRILPMTDEQWRQLDYPSKTLFAVRYIGSVNEPVAEGTQFAELLIHADALSRLEGDPNSRASRALMAFLVTEASAQVIVQSYQDWKSSDEAVMGSPLSGFLKKINRLRRIELPELKQLVEEPGAPRLRALLQSDQALIRSIVEV